MTGVLCVMAVRLTCLFNKYFFLPHSGWCSVLQPLVVTVVLLPAANTAHQFSGLKMGLISLLANSTAACFLAFQHLLSVENMLFVWVEASIIGGVSQHFVIISTKK